MLNRMGHRFTVVTSKFSYLTGETKAAVENDGAIEIRAAPVVGSWHRSYAHRLLAFLSFMITSVSIGLRLRDAEIVIGTSPPIFQTLSAWLVAAVRRRPFILEIRDLWPDFAVDLGVLRNRFLIFLARKFELFLYSRADAIIVNSPLYRENLRKKGIPESKISIIPNGVDASMFRPEDPGTAFRREHELGDKFVVMYTGAIGLANDIDCLLSAATALRDQTEVMFVIVGDGKELRRLQRESDSLRLDNVRFVGAQPKQRIPNVVAAADVCIATLRNVPSLQTTYPNKVFDYMAAGRPTVLAIGGAIREVVEKSRGGICVPPGDDAAIVEAIFALYRSPDLRREMGENARSYVKLHFDRQLQAEQMAQLLSGFSVGEPFTSKTPDVVAPPFR